MTCFVRFSELSHFEQKAGSNKFIRFFLFFFYYTILVNMIFFKVVQPFAEPSPRLYHVQGSQPMGDRYSNVLGHSGEQ